MELIPRLVTFYVLFFIHVGTRKVYLGGITTSPNDGWMKQASRNLTMMGCAILDKCRFLIRTATLSSRRAST